MMRYCCLDDEAAVSQQRTARKLDVSDLYAAVQHHHQRQHQQQSATAAELHVNVQHNCLRPRLRDYQKTAVLWMLTKERFKSHTADDG